MSRATLLHSNGEIRVCVCVWNVHTYGLTTEQVHLEAARIEADNHWSSDDPLTRTALLLGDFNLPSGDAHLRDGRPEPSDVAHAGGQHRRRWGRIWLEYAEVTEGEPTHYTTTSGVSARLARTFMSVPGRAAFGLVVRSV